VTPIPQHDFDLELIDPKTKHAKWAVYLPAISTFMAKYIGRQKHHMRGFIPEDRIPSTFNNGIAGLNWMDKNDAYFFYSHNLYSAGHSDLTGQCKSESMLFERDLPSTFVLADSGGFQIGKGVWSADWTDPSCPKAMEKRTQVLDWMDNHLKANYGMILDVPPWLVSSAKARDASGVKTFYDSVKATMINNEFFMTHRNGTCKFLNVLHGNNHAEAMEWYSLMKKFCDSKQYEQPFNGWSFGNQTSSDPHLALKLLVMQKFDGLLEPGIHDWLHFLGNSNLEWSLLLSDVQRSIRKHHNPNLTISYDCATPFLSSTFGTIYYDTHQTGKEGWTFFVGPSIDDKKYSADTRMLKDIFEQDGIYDYFQDSPISARLMGKDICPYGPTTLNKLGKIGRTSWDSVSYAYQMTHNVWEHIECVMEANRQYDQGIRPPVMMTVAPGKKNVLYYDRQYCADIIDDIFATDDYEKALTLVDHYDRYWMQFKGRASCNTGPKTKNSLTAYNDLFE
jgi:hypothetical protein